MARDIAPDNPAQTQKFELRKPMDSLCEDSCEKSQLSSKSKGFGTFTAFKHDILGVGSCKFDTYGFNINNLQKQFFDFENVDFFI